MNRDDCLKVIGHDHKFIEGYIVEMHGHFFPLGLGDPSDGGEMHGFVAHHSEIWLLMPGADSDEVQPAAGVIPRPAADAFNAVFLPEECHALLHDRRRRDFLHEKFRKYSEAGEFNTFKRGKRPIHIPTNPRVFLIACFNTAGL